MRRRNIAGGFVFWFCFGVVFKSPSKPQTHLCAFCRQTDLKYECWNCTWIVRVETALEMRLLKLTQNVSFEFCSKLEKKIKIQKQQKGTTTPTPPHVHFSIQTQVCSTLTSLCPHQSHLFRCLHHLSQEIEMCPWKEKGLQIIIERIHYKKELSETNITNKQKFQFKQLKTGLITSRTGMWCVRGVVITKRWFMDM